ncbi:MAG: hypothetical protein SCABRO_03783 [Candidatus Scalindua brodae]|uniref:Uncharacterized protein n=1 Tax=Candidatus Scalindua brodae TaxID=237368 RepID=A0A0B0EEH3_9BACT|nr:MAG: hypothetical protein SCABRO_03783 [Candidatus Scalindua brodae]
MKTSHVYIVFADISFLLCGILCLGYVFVDVKKNEQESVLFEKSIEFPTLSGQSEVVYGDNRDSIEIEIPQEGGRYVVNGKPILKEQIAASLIDVDGKSITLCIDKNAPSGDTLYLYSILNDLNANVTVPHLMEKQKNVR